MSVEVEVGGIQVRLTEHEDTVRLEAPHEWRVFRGQSPEAIAGLLHRSEGTLYTTLAARASTRVPDDVVRGAVLALLARTAQVACERPPEDYERIVVEERDLRQPEDTLYAYLKKRLGDETAIREAMCALLGWDTERYDRFLQHLEFLRWK